MTLELLAAFAAAFGMAGLALALRWATGGRVPRWAVPAAAAAGMIGFAIWAEYAWEGRARAGLPPGFAVAAAPATASPLRPWTYAVPLVTRMTVVDLTLTRRHPVRAELALTRVVTLARWAPNDDRRVVFDCARAARVDVTEGIAFSDAGELTRGAWTALAPDDPVLRTVCGAG